jgi:hypothetical protein
MSSFILLLKESNKIPTSACQIYAPLHNHQNIGMDVENYIMQFIQGSNRWEPILNNLEHKVTEEKICL